MEPAKTESTGARVPGSWFLCAALAAVTLVVCWPAVHCEFLDYDDPAYFTSNDHVKSGLSPANIVWAFTTGHASNWHPLTWLSLMFDAQLFGDGPVGPHAINLMFHAANTALLFLLLRRLTGAVWRSAMVAALFALHPLHVESVAWVSERKDLLSTFFTLLSLWAYARYAAESKVRSPKSKVYYLGTLLLFALALMSKPMAVTLPFLLLLLDWWPLRRISDFGFRISDLTPANRPTLVFRLLLEKVPFLLLAGIVCVITVAVQHGAVIKLANISMSMRIENAFISCARYLGKTFWPAALANPYPYPEHWPVWLVFFSVALFVGISVAAVKQARKYPFVAAGWFWFVGMLIPVIGLVQVGVAAMADRYTYLPLVGVFIILVWGVGEGAAGGWMRPPLIKFMAAAILAVCAWRTRDQLGYWQNSGAFFRHTLAVTENNMIACNNLGTWLMSQNQVPEAAGYFREALRIDSNYPDALANLGYAHSRLGELAEAIDFYRRALLLRPEKTDTLFNLGNAHARLGQWDQAIAAYRRALQVDSNQADVLNNLGMALATKKQFAEAITNYAAALQLKPDSADAHNNIAFALLKENRPEEAILHYREALRLTPRDARIYVNLGDALARQGQSAEAAKSYEQALRLEPGDARTQAKLDALGIGK